MYAIQPSHASPRVDGRKIPFPPPLLSVPSQYTVVVANPASRSASWI